MSIPASVGLYIDWKNGSGTYTAATPDKPNGHSFTFDNSTIDVEAAAPWNGQKLATLTSWNSAITSTISSAVVSTTSGRFLVEIDSTAYSGADHLIMVRHLANEFLGHFWAQRVGGTNLRVSMSWNSESSIAEVDLGTYPTTAFALEIIYDATNATANQRLRARVWSIGGSPGAFVDATYTFGPSGTMSEFTQLRLGEGEQGGLRFGRVIASNSITEDLSLVSEASPAATPLVPIAAQRFPTALLAR